MKSNQVNQCIIDEEDFIELLYQGKTADGIVVNTQEWITKYNMFCQLFEIDKQIDWEQSSDLSESDFIKDCLANWQMPESYKNYDLKSYLLNKCKTQEQTRRVLLEWDLFKERDMIIVLQFLKYFIDTLEENKVLWGVGRGSSVASYILFILKVHRIDPIKYNLDIKEFLK